MPDTRQPTLTVELDRNKVTLEIMCADRYAAIKLYDELIEKCRGGEFTFSLVVAPHAG